MHHADRRATSTSQVCVEHFAHCGVGGRVGDNSVNGAKVLLDVHRNAPPRIRLARIGAEAHRRRGVVGKLGGDNAHRCPSLDRGVRNSRQSRLLAGDDDHPAEEVDIVHVHSLQFRR